jgi:hypothetical protein
VFYTQTLELAPTHHVALANRSACFLKMAEHDKALGDAEACIVASPDFVKVRRCKLSRVETSVESAWFSAWFQRLIL